MIDFQNIHKDYGSRRSALVNLNLKIPTGAFVYVTGPSGAGKSTLLRLILRTDVATRGKLFVLGQDVAALPTRALPDLRRNIGAVFQDFRLLVGRTAHDNVALTLDVTGVPRKERQARVFDTLNWVGLGHRAQHRVEELSGGEQQRIAIARALVGNPPIILADEPTGNLDRASGEQVMALFEAAHRRGATVVFATHDGLLLKRHSKPEIALERGRQVA